MTVNKINDHEEQALARLITQYKGKVNLEGVIKTATTQIQELEDMLFQILDETWLSTAVGQQLDNLGDLLNEDRGGLSDDDYRAVLSIAVARYNSEGTIEDIISIFDTLVNADSIQVQEIFPAGFSLNAVNADPLISASEIEDAIRSAKPAAVELSSISYSPTEYFGFDGDLTALGFGDETDIDVGGVWTSISIPGIASYLLLENGAYLLLENGGKLVL